MNENSTSTWEEELGLASSVRALELDLEARAAQWPAAAQEIGRWGLDTYGGLERCVDLAARAGQLAGPELDQARSDLSSASRAYWAVVVAHDYLAAYFAKRIAARTPLGPDVEFSDLVQVVRIAMYEAAKRFRPEKGFRFRTYAKWWVMSAIERLGTPVALSSPMRALKVQVVQHADRLQASGEPATAARLAELTGSSPEKVGLVLSGTEFPVSLEGPDGLHLVETLRDERPGIQESMDLADLAAHIERLTEDESVVIRYLFGIGVEKQSQRQVGEQLGISRDGVRAIREHALQTLSERMGAAQSTRRFRPALRNKPRFPADFRLVLESARPQKSWTRTR